MLRKHLLTGENGDPGIGERRVVGSEVEAAGEGGEVGRPDLARDGLKIVGRATNGSGCSRLGEGPGNWRALSGARGKH